MQQAELDLLVIAAQQGEQKAFEGLYTHFQKPLLRYAYLLCNDADIAQDATQETWLKIAKDIRKVHDQRALRSWLYHTVRWRVTDILRCRHRRSEIHETYDEEIHCQVDPAEGKDTLSLRQAINCLPIFERQIIHLFYLDELKIREIATILDIPEGTVKSRLFKARQLLNQQFSM